MPRAARPPEWRRSSPSGPIMAQRKHSAAQPVLTVLHSLCSTSSTACDRGWDHYDRAWRFTVLHRRFAELHSLRCGMQMSRTIAEQQRAPSLSAARCVRMNLPQSCHDGKNNTSLSFPLQTSLCVAFVRLLYLQWSLSVDLYGFGSCYPTVRCRLSVSTAPAKTGRLTQRKHSAAQPVLTVQHRLCCTSCTACDSGWDHYDRAWQFTVLRSKKRACMIHIPNPL